MAKIDTTVKELVSMVGRGELRLPEIQRRYVWTSTRVRDLLDSLYRGYPSGTILVWETTQEAPTRDLQVEQGNHPFMTQKLLLDGQQRLTSLCAVLNGEAIKVKNKKKPVEILFNLAHPDGPPAEFTEVEDDYIDPTADSEGVDEDEVDDEDQNIQRRLGKRTFVVASSQLLASPTWVKVSDVFKHSNDWTLLKHLNLAPDSPEYEKYSQRLQKLRTIRDYPYVMQVLERNLEYEEVAEIFVRVNSLGVKLKGSDLAMAQITAKWQNSLKLFEEFAEKIEDNTWFSLDIGLIVRSLVVFATGQSRFKTVHGIPADRLQTAWARTQDGIEFAVNFLRANAGIEDESLLSSPLIIIAVAAYGHVKNFELTSQEEKDLLRWVHCSNVRSQFGRGSTETILDQNLTLINKTESVAGMMDLLLQQVGRLIVEPQDFVGRGARSPLFSTSYLALKRNGAKDWLSGLGLSLTHQGKWHYIEYHHIFPKSLLAAEGYEKSEVNEIANLAFISGKANRKITNREPEKYIPEIVEKHGSDMLKDHCIPTDPYFWKVANYREFLEWRRAKLATEINDLIALESYANQLLASS